MEIKRKDFYNDEHFYRWLSVMTGAPQSWLVETFFDLWKRLELGEILSIPETVATVTETLVMQCYRA